jgi:hypothetical protein
MRRRNRIEQGSLLEEWRRSGESIRGFCKRKSITVDSFRRWKRNAIGVPGEEAGFLPVVLRQESWGRGGDRPCRIIVTGGAVIIECSAGTDAQALEAALRTAVAVCGPILQA